MSREPSKAQRKLLERLAGGASLSYSTLTGNAWSSDGRFTIKVNNNTFNSLHMRRWIVADAIPVLATTSYRITEAGLAALAEGRTPTST